MKINRRSILGLFGATAAAPKVTLQALDIPVIDINEAAYASNAVLDAGGAHYGTVQWAVKEAAARVLRTPQQVEKDKRAFYLDRMDVNVHALRSVSLGTKMRMSREANWRNAELQRESFIQGLISGVIKEVS